MNTNKLAENLAILNGYADGLLAALYNIKHALDPDAFPVLDSFTSDGSNKTASVRQDQPRFLADPAFQAIVKIFLKRFPECPDLAKVAGYQMLAAESKSIAESLKPFYQTFVDVMEFCEAAQATLLSCEKLSGLNCVHHHIITDPFFSLLTSLVMVHLSMQEMVQSKKVVVAAYHFLYVLDNSMVESKFARLCSFLTQYDRPLAAIQDSFTGMGMFITTLLQSLSVEFSRYGFLTVEQLRKEGGLLIGNNVKSAAVDDSKYRMLPYFNKYATYIVVSFVCCPGELLKQSLCADMLKTVLTQNLVIGQLRTEVLNVVAEFDQTIKNNPKLSKLKSIVSESIATGLLRSTQLHQERREYLRYVLRQLVSLCDDRPFLLGYKLPIVECNLKLAREELAWYMAHHDKTIAVKFPKNVPKQQQATFDPNVIEIMALVFQLQDVVMRHQKTVEEFYANLFTTHYAPLIENVIMEIMRTNAPSDYVTQNLMDILSAVQSTTTASKFDSLRLNFSRLLVHFHSIDTTVAISTVPDFVNIMNEIYIRSRYVDTVAEVVEKAASLEFLYYYRPLLQEHYDDVLRNQPDRAQHCWVFPRLAAGFTKNALPYYPHEFDRIGVRSVQFAEDFYVSYSRTCANLVHAVVAFQIQFANQVLPDQAANFVPDRRDKKQNRKLQERITSRPGHESVLKVGDPVLTTLPEMKQLMVNALSCCILCENVTVHDVTFSCSNFIREVLVAKLRGFLMSSVFPEETPISPSRETSDEPPFAVKRPSVFLNEVNAYASTLMDIDGSVPLKLYDLLRDVLLEQIDLEQAKKIGLDAPEAAIAKKDQKSAPKSKKGVFAIAPQTYSFLVTYANWYVDHVREKGASGVATYSPLKKATYSVPGSQFKSQQFTDPSELVALCRLIGPNGVRYIDQRLNQHIFLLTKDIKDIVTLNQETFQTIQTVWYQDGRLEDSIKALKQMDVLIQCSINLGVILEFRNNLFDALGTVLDETVPTVYQTVTALHSRYPDNIYGIPDYLPLDNMANFVGIHGTAESTLRTWMQSLCRNPNADHRVYALFPWVFAVVLRILAMDDRSCYSTLFDALNNNSSSIVLTFNLLMTSLVAITAPNDTEQMTQIHREFLQTSATLLLQMKAARTEKELLRGDSIKSVLLLLHRFAELSPFLTEDALEEYVPYWLIRATYSDFFRKEGLRKRLQAKPDEEVVAAA